MRTTTSPPTSHLLLIAALSATIALVGTGCGGPGPANDTDPSAATVNSSQTTPSTSTTSTDTPPEDRMKIQITIGQQRFDATLAESAAARDLVAQLPLTIDMVDHGGVEKTGRLPSPLSLDGQPDGADPDVGHVGYYAPGNDLVLYYGDQSFFAGIVILGRLDGDAAPRLRELDGPVTARVEAHDD